MRYNNIYLLKLCLHYLNFNQNMPIGLYSAAHINKWLVIGWLYSSQIIFDCQIHVLLIHNNCVKFFPTRMPIMPALPSTHGKLLNGVFLEISLNPELDIFHRSLYVALLRWMYEYSDIQKGPFVVSVCFPSFEVQAKHTWK